MYQDAPLNAKFVAVSKAVCFRKILCSVTIGKSWYILLEFNVLNHRQKIIWYSLTVTLLTPNDPFMGRTAPLTSKHCILYIYSTNIGTEYFKHALYSPVLSLQNAVCFIMLTSFVPVLFTFYIQVC